MSGDVEGGTSGELPATPGSYGEPPQGFRLPDATSLGGVRLQVADLDCSLRFYQDVLGLRVVTQAAAEASLAAGGDEGALVHLVERSGSQPIARRARLGLVPLRHPAARPPGTRTAGAPSLDHGHSRRRRRSPRERGVLHLGSGRPRHRGVRRSTAGVVASCRPTAQDGHRPGGRAGPARDGGRCAVDRHARRHRHGPCTPPRRRPRPRGRVLRRGLGFDKTAWSYPGALFLGAGGYHHHVGVNTWAGPGAAPAGPDDARLLEWTLTLPDAIAVAAARASVEAAGFAVEPSGSVFVARDPWGTAVRVLTR